MPSDYADHYRNLLARHYSWMFGLSFDEKVTEQRTILEPLLQGVPRGLAVDLGCGPGFQSVALAQLGFSPVLALDTSAELLAELASHAAGHAIHPIEADILTLADHIHPGQAAVIVCMGDTLTHLLTRDAVRRLFAAAAAGLAPGGAFILTWRDLTPELQGPDRFIPVRSDDSTIMTCFLEYTGADTVQVHDLVYTHTPPDWALARSSYPKLRLAPAWIAQELAAVGLAVLPQNSAGRLSLAAALRRNPGSPLRSDR